MTISKSIKIIRNTTRENKYKSINMLYKHGNTLKDACECVGISVFQYYYICKVLNKDPICKKKTNKSKNKIQHGGNNKNNNFDIKKEIDKFDKLVCNIKKDINNAREKEYIE